ncbi:hypothetical protein ABZS66_45580 [Dactylosporangium sp. NPDC005572]|uniref:hypothetical protein n=1 Tax=Dactylosporangium sp. NPDC005572 TaxID=3156889 RepID=UPI0033AAE0D9
MSTLRAALIAITILGLAAGCGRTDGEGASPAAAATTATSTSSTSPAPAAPQLDAKAVVDALVAAKLPVTKVVVQNEDTDPNDLFGRPNGYLSRASFDVPGGDPEADSGAIGRGGVVEVFADAAGAEARKKYIQDSLKSNPVLGTEYDYTNGPVLVRLVGKVKPSVARTFEPAVAALKP